jgi:alpha-beta hydrolase superfamily lysophospholipase
LIGARSLRLACGTWLPAEQPKAVVVLVHGYAEYAGRHRQVIEALVSRNYAVYTIDHRGHGESEGTRAHVERFKHYVDDLRLLVEKARAAFASLPLFLLAHSMGGLIAIHYALRYQAELAGLVVDNSALQVADHVPALIRILGRFLGLIAPKLPLRATRTGGENLLSRDPAIQEAFDADPLCYHGKVRAGMSSEVIKAAADARAQLPQLTLPLLISYGCEDTYVNPSGSKLLFERAGSADKTLKAWEGCRHELFNELNKAEIIASAADWLDAHVP